MTFDEKLKWSSYIKVGVVKSVMALAILPVVPCTWFRTRRSSRSLYLLELSASSRLAEQIRGTGGEGGKGE